MQDWDVKTRSTRGVFWRCSCWTACTEPSGPSWFTNAAYLLLRISKKGSSKVLYSQIANLHGTRPSPSTFPLESASTHGHRSPRTVAWQTTARPSHTPPAPALSLPRPPSSPPPPALAPPPIPPSLLPTLPSAPSPRPKRTEDRGRRGTSGGTRFSLGSFLGRRWECREVSEGGRMGLRQLF